MVLNFTACPYNLSFNKYIHVTLGEREIHEYFMLPTCEGHGCTPDMDRLVLDTDQRALHRHQFAPPTDS